MNQLSGYAIVRMPQPLVRAYDESMANHEAAELFHRLCNLLYPLPREAYRGTSRFPLMPLPSVDPHVLCDFEQSGCDVSTELAARRKFLEQLGGNEAESDFDEGLLPDLETARDVYSLLEFPSEYEIVQFVRKPFLTDVECLGFDVGYWGGGHYSILCDSAVRPLWHPPQPECFDELAQRLKMVNESFLFRNAEDAASFRAWYRTQSWAETEFRPDDFCIIQVNKPG